LKILISGEGILKKKVKMRRKLKKLRVRRIMRGLKKN